MDIASIEKLADKFAQTAPAVDPQERELVALLSKMLAAGNQAVQKVQPGATYSNQFRQTAQSLQAVVQELVNAGSQYPKDWNKWRR